MCVCVCVCVVCVCVWSVVCVSVCMSVCVWCVCVVVSVGVCVVCVVVCVCVWCCWCVCVSSDGGAHTWWSGRVSVSGASAPVWLRAGILLGCPRKVTVIVVGAFSPAHNTHISVLWGLSIDIITRFHRQGLSLVPENVSLSCSNERNLH